MTMLGSGTSSGIPMMGCSCAVCTSADPRSRRTRPGLRLDLESGVVIVDTSPDFREQALRFGVERVDAVLYTHPHADHVFGLDDLRGFNFRQRMSIPCYASARTMARLRQIFAYVFEDSPPKVTAPSLTKPSPLARTIATASTGCGAGSRRARRCAA